MKNNTKFLVVNGMLLATAISMQIVGRNFTGISQSFVGPIINTILLLSALSTDKKYSVMLAICTPITALLTGQLNTALGFFIPFICIGNIIYVLIFSILKNRDTHITWCGIKLVVASLCKYIFLIFSATEIIVVLNLGVAPKVLEKLAIAMGLPQLYTALIGGVFAIIIYKVVEKYEKSKIA